MLVVHRVRASPDGVSRRRGSILHPRKASPLIQLALLPSSGEELSLPSFFLDFGFPPLPCSLFEVPLDLISRYVCSICVVMALGVRKTQVKGDPQFLSKRSRLYDERLMTLICRILLKRPTRLMVELS